MLQAGGAAGLEAFLAGEREAAKPEFLRQRPKYYYYNEWMKTRIATLVGGWVGRWLGCGGWGRWQVGCGKQGGALRRVSAADSGSDKEAHARPRYLCPQHLPACLPAFLPTWLVLPGLQYPELPAPVVGKLLGMEANELDMILQYPRATQLTVSQ